MSSEFDRVVYPIGTLEGAAAEAANRHLAENMMQTKWNVMAGVLQKHRRDRRTNFERDRGSGETTRQMLAAPKGAVFIWCNDQLSYPRDLAKHLGRLDDIRIEGPSDMERLRGLRFSSVVVDHAAELSLSQWRLIPYITTGGLSDDPQS